MKRVRLLLLSTSLFAALSVSAEALDKSQPIRMIVAHPAGSVTDISSRVLADALGRELGQSVIVDNRPGGDGTIGLLEAVKAKPDGNTLFAGGFGGQLIPPLMKKDFPVDVDAQLTRIARPTEFANILLVSKELPVNSVGELIEYSKANPGTVNYGASGSATSSRLTAEMFMQETGADLTLVPYAGSPAALNDISSGIIQVMFANMPGTLGLIESGDVRALAVTSPYRVPQLPDVPTMIEGGVDGFAVTSWNSIFGPAGMTEEDVKTLSDAIVAAAKRPEAQEAFRKVGFEPVAEGSEDFTSFFDEERTRWKRVLDVAGLSQ